MKNSLFLLPFLFWINSAHAYLDPGTGSLIIQSVIAGFTGILFVVKTYWYKIKAFFCSSQKNILDDAELKSDIQENTNNHHKE